MPSNIDFLLLLLLHSWLKPLHSGFHCTLQEIVHILFWNYYQESKSIFIKFTFSIYNQQLIFTFVISYSFYNNDDDSNGSKPLTLNRISKFSNGIHVKKTWELI
jgi:hypothetical protein